MTADDEERFEDDDFDDTGRYGIPELTTREHGWEPPHEHQKALDEYRKKHPFINPHDTMLELRPAGEWITRGGRHRVRKPELFGSLWKEGEVAVLFGGSGTGKSILAVQIAEAIARGGRRMKDEGGRMKNGNSSLHPSSLILHPSSGSQARRVLYLDFEHTTRQFAERYSAPSPIPGKLPVRGRFKFLRAEIKWDGTIPATFKGDLNAYLQHSIFRQIEESGARVVIIDNISYLAKNIMSNTACSRVMKTLKLWAATHNLSILVLAQAKTRRRNSPPARGGVAAASADGVVGVRIPHFAGRLITLDDIAGSRYIGDLADSVFAIGRSTFGDEYRYVKHLKSRSAPITHDESNVLTYSLSVPPADGAVLAPNSPPCLGGVAEGRGGSSANPHSADCQPPSANCLLGLTYLGPSQESDHLRDYAAELPNPRSAIRNPQLKSSRRTLIDGILDGSYARYLKD